MICSFVPADGLWLLGRARPQKFRNTFELAKVINGFIETIVSTAMRFTSSTTARPWDGGLPGYHPLE
jgi:hypothetical protein